MVNWSDLNSIWATIHSPPPRSVVKWGESRWSLPNTLNSITSLARRQYLPICKSSRYYLFYFAWQYWSETTYIRTYHCQPRKQDTFTQCWASVDDGRSILSHHWIFAGKGMQTYLKHVIRTYYRQIAGYILLGRTWIKMDNRWHLPFNEYVIIYPSRYKSGFFSLNVLSNFPMYFVSLSKYVFKATQSG